MPTPPSVVNHNQTNSEEGISRRRNLGRCGLLAPPPLPPPPLRRCRSAPSARRLAPRPARGLASVPLPPSPCMHGHVLLILLSLSLSHPSPSSPSSSSPYPSGGGVQCDRRNVGAVGIPAARGARGRPRRCPAAAPSADPRGPSQASCGGGGALTTRPSLVLRHPPCICGRLPFPPFPPFPSLPFPPFPSFFPSPPSDAPLPPLVSQRLQVGRPLLHCRGKGGVLTQRGGRGARMGPRCGSRVACRVKRRDLPR